MTDFLPKDYEKPASQNKYFRLEVGKNKFRILSSAIIGWIDWTVDKKPVRTKERPEKSINPNRPVKHFWSFVIWDYKDNAVKIMEITQQTIQDSIIELHKDESWGDPKEYDITVSRIGEALETKYNVLPNPKADLTAEIRKAYSEMKIDLDQLYVNGDPFGEQQVTEPSEEPPTEELPPNF